MWLKKLITSLLNIFLFILLSYPCAWATPTEPQIAIIIDDLGFNYHNGLRAVKLPGEVTYAILPHSPYGTNLATQAHNKGKEIMLHLPMQAIANISPGPGTLNTQMQKEEFLIELRSNLSSVPYITGLNNHMGSLLTQKATPMNWLMDELKERNLFFVDSRTSHCTVAEHIAQTNGIPSTHRDVFLDNKQDIEYIHHQFVRLLLLAKRRGNAVAIAHPYPATLYYLEYALPKLAKHGFKLVSASALIPTYHG